MSEIQEAENLFWWAWVERVEKDLRNSKSKISRREQKIDNAKKELSQEFCNTWEKFMNFISFVVKLQDNLSSSQWWLKWAARSDASDMLYKIKWSLWEIRSFMEEKWWSDTMTSVNRTLEFAIDDIEERTIHEYLISWGEERDNIAWYLQFILTLLEDNISLTEENEIDKVLYILAEKKDLDNKTIKLNIKELKEDLHIIKDETLWIARQLDVFNNDYENFKKWLKAVKQHKKFKWKLDLTDKIVLQPGEFWIDSIDNMDGMNLKKSWSGRYLVWVYRPSLLPEKIVFIIHKDNKKEYKDKIKLWWKNRTPGRKRYWDGYYYSIEDFDREE